MKYHLPPITSSQEGFIRLSTLLNKVKQNNPKYLEISFKNCSFFDANMAAPLEVIISAASEYVREIKITELPSAVSLILRKNHFLRRYGYSPAHDSNNTTLPFLCLGLDDAQAFAKYLKAHLSGKGIPKMTDDLDKAFRKSIFEIFQNCATHSHSTDRIFVCGQFYPQRHHLELTISDPGIGIRSNVRRKLAQKISSVDAIRWALEEGNTTKTGNEPGGFGLKLLQEFIELNEGKVQIVSRQGMYEFKAGKKEFTKLEFDLPGTTVNIEINTNDRKTYGLRTQIPEDDIF